jgi:hypothetical protein
MQMNYVACVEFQIEMMPIVYWSVDIVQFEYVAAFEITATTVFVSFAGDLSNFFITCVHRSIRLAMGFLECQKGIGFADHAEQILRML